MRKDYNSHIDKPTKHTTSKGISYVTTFDVIRSSAGRELVDKHAAMAKALRIEKADPPKSKQ